MHQTCYLARPQRRWKYSNCTYQYKTGWIQTLKGTLWKIVFLDAGSKLKFLLDMKFQRHISGSFCTVFAILLESNMWTSIVLGTVIPCPLLWSARAYGAQYFTRHLWWSEISPWPQDNSQRSQTRKHSIESARKKYCV